MLSVRAVHVLQGLTCLVGARKAYRRPAVALALEVAAAGELVAIANRALRQGRYDTTCARGDVAFGLVGLVGLAAATTPEDRTSSVNWMLPLTVGSCLGSATLENPVEGALMSAVLAATYVVTTSGSMVEGGGRSASAIANALSYPGFFVVGRIVVGFARRMADQVDEARQLALDERARAAAEAARNREHRLLHDSALQTLEAIGSREDLSPGEVRAAARREASALRRALSGEVASGRPGDLGARLVGIADDLTRQNLVVELVGDTIEAAPPDEIAAALCEAAREALTNVAKHAGTDRAVLRAVADASGWRVTVRDHGTGFDTDAPSDGFGLRQSIHRRIEEVGGTVTISSQLGHGTKVELWVPA
jgi:signal transduction histidine kinase